jgi:hypothetical protein
VLIRITELVLLIRVSGAGAVSSIVLDVVMCVKVFEITKSWKLPKKARPHYNLSLSPPDHIVANLPDSFGGDQTKQKFYLQHKHVTTTLRLN